MDKDISKIDKNFVVETNIKKDNIKFYDVRRDPFDIYGLYDARNLPKFTRMPDEVAKTVGSAEKSENVRTLAFDTAGGRVRFSTDSSYIAIHVERETLRHMPHMTLTGSSGFDLYMDDPGGGSTFCGSYQPSTSKPNYESIKEFNFKEKKTRYFTINFPLYNTVTNLYIGLEDTANVGHGKKYKIEKPVVYYGSSITQGGCVGRPGLAYEHIITRKLDCDHINLGFSGSGKGEDEMVDYLASIDMSVFVADYDHNSPNAEHLERTVRNMYSKMRAAHPELPMIFISRPDFDKPLDCEGTCIASLARRDAIYRMFYEAFRAGDKKVYFIDGEYLFGNEMRDCCTVDLTHPNDLGHARIAEAIGYRLGKIFEGSIIF